MTDNQAVLFYLAIVTLVVASVWIIVFGTWDDEEIPPPKDAPIDFTGRKLP